MPENKSLRVIKRNGKVADFAPERIFEAIRAAYIETREALLKDPSHPAHGQAEAVSDELMLEEIQALVGRVSERLVNSGQAAVRVESIQDVVELELMRKGASDRAPGFEYYVARSYVLYRESRNRRRRKRKPTGFNVTRPDGRVEPLTREEIEARMVAACANLEGVDPKSLTEGVLRELYSGITQAELDQALILAARSNIESDPNHSQVAARLLLSRHIRELAETFEGVTTEEPLVANYSDYFPEMLRYGVKHELIDPRLLEYDLSVLAESLLPERDLQFTYLGLQTLYDRYFIHQAGLRIELPQAFFMRVAMGLALNEEGDREARAIEFYRLLSSFDFMSSTPTLFNSGTLHPQLSSCYLTTVPDDLYGIFGAFQENAMLSKFAGGLGNDWTRVRALGAAIKGTNGQSQGIIPFLKVNNDTAVAVNQGGKRKGAICAYLETWHLDVEEFLELRKNTGDDRRRTHDMNTANWIPDLFMERVLEEGDWTLFSPDETPDLHDLSGEAFRKAYSVYEAKAERGEITNFRRVPAVQLWRKMLNMLFETGHPWIAFKDPCNIRYTNQHQGVVHSSNLCTEITLHTNDEETAVCNLGSVNLVQHINEEGELDLDKLRQTVNTAVRMLDNVIGYNYYAVDKARRSNMKHRPVGLGLMGFHDALYKMKLSYASDAAVKFADESMEAVSYMAINASADLARERGAYETFEGSLWSQGVLPIDSIGLLEASRGKAHTQMNRDQSGFNWDALREKVRGGMRNSNVMAIAPTATISNICGVSQSIEPTYLNLYVKSNLSGEFTVINSYLVKDLKALGLWDRGMIQDLKMHDGSVQPIARVPEDLKARYATAFEMDARWLIEAGSRRQKWIDQAQSLNLYVVEPDGRKLDELYKLAWLKGLKTTYYLRARGATDVEKSTLETGFNRLNSVRGNDQEGVKACSILDPDCEACQ